MQIQSLAIFAAIAGFVAAAPTPENTQPASPFYTDFPEGTLPLHFSTAVEARENALQKRWCPGETFPNCIQIQGQVCIWGCGFRNNFQCLVGCPAETHANCVEWC
ncbi:hypothetical protein RB213_002055 [Colletotrichum asianum]